MPYTEEELQKLKERAEMFAEFIARDEETGKPLHPIFEFFDERLKGMISQRQNVFDTPGAGHKPAELQMASHEKGVLVEVRKIFREPISWYRETLEDMGRRVEDEKLNHPLLAEIENSEEEMLRQMEEEGVPEEPEEDQEDFETEVEPELEEEPVEVE